MTSIMDESVSHFMEKQFLSEKSLQIEKAQEMARYWKPAKKQQGHMNKQLIFLLALTFIFLFSGSVYGEELEVKKTYWDNGKLKINPLQEW